jgi:hypothetical protein
MEVNKIETLIIDSIELRGDYKDTRVNKNFKLLFSKKGLGKQYTVISVN